MSQTGENNKIAKVALLIGVSESSLPPLPAAIKDVEAMQRVLSNSEIGGFTVRSLPNPERQAMEEAIETLFEDRQKNDLVLLYFSGHGVKDENGRLYFTTRSTRKNEKGGLVQATVVSASFVQEIMKKSPSKRQVVILDCCFSGAFAEDMRVKDDSSVDVVNQLGGEGRAILTSSTSTQYSFEQKESELSIYTRHLVEGIETGAADTDDNGVITVDELHDYTKKKVEEAAPMMRPEIYPIKGGYTIVLAKAPVGDPKLKYRKELERVSRRGEISSTGRIVLKQLQIKLKLSPEETIAIENEALQPYREYQKRLQEYEQAFVEAASREKFPLSTDTQDDLQRLQQILGLRQEDVATIETRIIANKEKDVATPIKIKHLIFRGRGFRELIGVLSVGIIVGIIISIGGTVLFFISRKPLIISCANKQYLSNKNISLGDKILLQEDRNPNKDSGVKALAEGYCADAVENFKSSLKVNRNDPEALIYLNNAKARLRVAQLKIAVSVPIGSNPNVAKEILRGVAQAQDEENHDNGINGKLLEVEIANDNNQPTLAQNIAAQFVKDSSILAVVGHNASEASISAAPVYQQKGLVMISPTSFALNSDEIGNYIFRTVPRSDVLAVTLSNYITNRTAKTNIAICLDSKSIEAVSFTNAFKKAMVDAGRKVNPTGCDFSDSTFNSSTVISQAINSGADSLLLAPHIDRINKALELVQANQVRKRRLDLFGNSTLYTHQTLKDGKANVNSMTLVVAWFPTATSDNSFLTNSNRLWGGPVTWRTVMAYKATKAIVTGLQQSRTREGLQQVLQSQALGNGPDSNAILVKVRQKPANETGYEFTQLSP